MESTISGLTDKTMIPPDALYKIQDRKFHLDELTGDKVRDATSFSFSKPIGS